MLVPTVRGRVRYPRWCAIEVGCTYWSAIVSAIRYPRWCAIEVGYTYWSAIVSAIEFWCTACRRLASEEEPPIEQAAIVQVRLDVPHLRPRLEACSS